MDSEQYGTSDIIWKRTDPKTVELSNVPPPMPPPGLPETPALSREAQLAAMSGARVSDAELEHWQQGMKMRERTRDTPAQAANDARAQKKFHRQQMRNFDKYLKSGEAGPLQAASGIQEMMESGALWNDENGDLWGSIPSGEERRQRILSAAQEWGKLQNQFTRAFEDAGINPQDNSPEAQAHKQQIMSDIAGWKSPEQRDAETVWVKELPNR